MKPRWLLTSSAVVLFLIGPFAASLRAQPNGVIEDLGTLGLDSYASAVNASGQTAGHSLQTPTDIRGFVTMGGSLQPIPTFGGLESSALGLNDAGVVVGFGRDAGGEPRAFRYEPSAVPSLVDIGTLGGPYAVAYGINAAGTIVGYAADGEEWDQAFAWTPGGMQPLGTLGGVVSYAYGINDYGAIVGEAHTGDDTLRAFVYSGGIMQDLGTLGGMDSAAHAINGAGVVAGWSQIAGFGTRAFRYTPGGVMQELPTLGGSMASGEAIAPDGTIVGSSTNATNQKRACLWTPGNAIVDLNDRIDPGLGWVLTDATGINGSGQIVGFGSFNGQVHAYRLTLPLDAPPAIPTIQAVTASPSSLWPANNKLVPVVITVDASDGAGGVPACVITGVTSNEPADADIVLVGALEVQLRAKRLGGGNGRTYRIDVACGSSPDAMATGFVEVVVPKNQAGGAQR